MAPVVRWALNCITSYAVIVGIADYPGPYDDLNYTALDAIGMRDALMRYPQWEEQNVELLLDSTLRNVQYRTNAESHRRQNNQQRCRSVLFFRPWGRYG